ncbi:MAG: hypothetical protein M3Z03_12745 [Actinomycetota bacterium]|nr:hypothetical protein [Actinomycetota bacterium]
MEGGAGGRAGGRADGGPDGGDPGRFERWLAELRVDDAARSRARRHWLRSAAEEEATMAGVLLDLAERGATVAVTTRVGRRHHGRLVLVGDDFLVLRAGAHRHVVLRAGTVGTVRSTADATAPIGDRAVRSDRHLQEVLVALAAERLAAAIVLDNGDLVTGEVRSMGQDVVVLQSDGPSSPVTYLALDAIVEVTLDGPLGAA